MELTAQIDASEVINSFDKLAWLIEHKASVLDAIGHAIAEQVRLGFRDGRSPRGESWEPLTHVTLSRRKNGGVGAKPLMDTGRLRDSIGHAVQGDTVEIGTNVEYAALHQFGAAQGAFGLGNYKKRNGSFPIPWGNVPARPFLPIQNGQTVLPDAWAQKASAIIANHLKRAFP